jgi:hypothetical protein
MSKTFVKVEDFTGAFNNLIEAVRVRKTLIGIPEEDNARNPEDGNQPIGNAAILYINNFGSPANNIPPRPVMNIGIFNAQDEIVEELKKAVQNGFKKGSRALNQYYERVGIIGSNSVKRTINDQIGIDPPAESTLEARRARGFKGTKALLVTGQTRNAITYVVTDGSTRETAPPSREA